MTQKAKRRGPSKAAEARRLSKELHYPVTPSAIEVWLRNGYPLEDTPALVAALLKQRRTPPGLIEAIKAGKIEEPPEGAGKADLRTQLLEEQVKKTAAEARLKEVRAAVEEGDSMPVAEVREAAMRLASLEKSYWLQLENILPPMLEGLTAAQMKEKIGQHSRKMLGELERLAKEIGKS